MEQFFLLIGLVSWNLLERISERANIMAKMLQGYELLKVYPGRPAWYPWKFQAFRSPPV